MLGARQRGKWVKGVKTYKLSVIRKISFGDVMYSMMTILIILYCVFESC